MLKKNSFIYRVEADITISKLALEQIAQVAERHYDGKCKEFGKTTVRYWLWTFDDKPTLTERTLTVKWNEFDTVAKILECERYVPGVNLYAAWTQIFREVRDESERVNAHHMMNDAETYTQNYRDELKRKYGDGKVTIPSGAATA